MSNKQNDELLESLQDSTIPLESEAGELLNRVSKNEMAVALGKLRWAKQTEEQRSLHMKMMSERRWKAKREKDIEGEIGWKVS